MGTNRCKVWQGQIKKDFAILVEEVVDYMSKDFMTEKKCAETCPLWNAVRVYFNSVSDKGLVDMIATLKKENQKLKNEINGVSE